MITVTEKQTREISRKFPKEKITRARIYFLKVKPHYQSNKMQIIVTENIVPTKVAKKF